ncbi:MAG TPA: GNAT family N-acetyltransferase [Candidatus Melainabacteria bacterium]|nr:GNAT family N-acetyltransferase [Candidatus Melainabacteria bacterium]
MRIIDLQKTAKEQIGQVAEILNVSFHGHCPDYEDMKDALKKVMESFDDHQLSRIAVDDDGTVLGWIGGIRMYNGNVWEIDPLVVKKNTQGRGVGKALIEDFEVEVGKVGARTIWLGTDDEDGRTNLGDCELYPDVLGKASRIEDLGGHPFKFYQRMGFEIVGVLPDANGFGKPDIYMAKRVKTTEEAKFPRSFETGCSRI